MENTTDKPGMHQNASTRIFQFAKNLRLKMTEPETLLWERLRKKQMMGYRFRRQHPISQYIADFYCHPLKLIIEVEVVLGRIRLEIEEIEKGIAGPSVP